MISNPFVKKLIHCHGQLSILAEYEILSYDELDPCMVIGQDPLAEARIPYHSLTLSK